MIVEWMVTISMLVLSLAGLFIIISLIAVLMYNPNPRRCDDPDLSDD